MSLFWYYELVIFESVDDVLMMCMTSGFFGTTTEKIIHPHFFIGKLFETLYTTSPSVNWYPVLYYALELLTILFLFILLTRNFSLVQKWIFLLLLWAICLPVILKLQYTMVAYLCGISGILGILKYEKQRDFLILITGVLLFMVCIFIRWEVAASILLITSVFFLQKLYVTKRFKVLLPLVILVISLFLIHFSNILYYQTGDDNYLIYNEKRRVLMDLPNKEVSPSILEEYHWSTNDFALLKRWNWIDSEVYTKEKIASIALQLNGTHSLNESVLIIEKAIQRTGNYFILFFIATIIALYLFSGNKKVVLLIFIWHFIIIASLALSAKLPFRVFYPILMSSVLFFIYYASLTKRKTTKIIAFACTIAVIVITMLFVMKRKENVTNFRTRVTNNLQYIKENASKTFIYLGGSNTPFEYLPMKNNPKYSVAENVLLTGWHIYTDTYESFLKGKNIDNLLPALVNDSSLVVVTPPKELLITFFEEHYNKNISFTKIDSVSSIPLLKESYYIQEIK